MIANSLRSRGVSFAYLFGPPRFVRRDEAYQIHGAVCTATACEDLSFQYFNPEAQVRGSQAFQLQFQRKEGRGAYTIMLDNAGLQAPIHLLFQYTWPPSLEHVKETIDNTSEAVFDNLEGNWQKVLAEVRIRAQCDARDNSGLRSMREQFFRLGPAWFDSLVGLKGLSAKFEVPASSFTSPMENPRRELTIETLKEDPRGLYIELMSQWPQLPEAIAPGAGVDMSSIRPIDAKPSEYIDEAYEFLKNQLRTVEG